MPGTSSVMTNLVVIPAYNEEASLERTLAELQELPESYELLVVNDGSRDQTEEIAARVVAGSRLKAHVVSLSMNSGIGAAMQTGYLFAARAGRYRYVVQFDADGQHHAGAIEALVGACEARNLDLCVGSRFVAEAPAGGDRSTRLRRVGIRFFARLISVLSGVKVTDPTSGFRCAGPRAWARFADRYPDDYPEPESLFWCAREGMRVAEIPVLMNARQGGISSIRLRHSFYYMLKVSLSIVIDRLRARTMA